MQRLGQTLYVIKHKKTAVLLATGNMDGINNGRYEETWTKEVLYLKQTTVEKTTSKILDGLVEIQM